MVQKFTPFLLLVVKIFFLASPFFDWANAETIFDGYYKIMNGHKKIGFFVQRYEFDVQTKKFYSTYFIQTNDLAGKTSESLKASADEKFQPIAYEYKVTTPQMIKTVEAKFDHMIMNAVISQTDSITKKTSSPQKQTITKKVPRGTFLSTFLNYLILEKGYIIGNKYDYSAIAEENAEFYSGEAIIKDEQLFLDKKVFRVLNHFNNIHFISFMTSTGQVLGSQSPLQRMTTELVPQSHLATEGLSLPIEHLKKLFGTWPTISKNIFVEEKTLKPDSRLHTDATPRPSSSSKEKM